MTPADKAALRALAEKATPGVWRIAVTDDTRITAGRKVVADCGGYPSSNNEEANAAYIAAAHPAAVLALLDEVERLREAAKDAANLITDLLSDAIEARDVLAALDAAIMEPRA